MKRNIIILLILISIFGACHPTQILFLSYENNYHENLIIKENNSYTITISSEYNISKQLTIFIKIENLSKSNIEFLTNNFPLETNILKVKSRNVYVDFSNVGESYKNENVGSYIIEPNKKVTFELFYILYSTKDKKHWPWPKNEEFVLFPGSIQTEDALYKISKVEMKPESLIGNN